MKNAKLAAGILATLSIAVILLALLTRSHQQKDSSFSPNNMPLMSSVYDNTTSTSREPITEDTDEDAEILNPAPPDPKLLEEVISWWKAPIVFYGKVTDNDGHPIPNAKVNLMINDLSKEGTTEYHKTADSNGRFEVLGLRGKHLHIDITKEGYYQGRGSYRSFQYAGPGDHFTPNKDKPEIFRLYKKGQQAPLLARQKLFTFPPDGSFHSLLLFKAQRKEGTLDDADLLVSFRRDHTQPRGSQSWSLLLQVPKGGGLIESNEEFMFLAPETGYQKNVQLGAGTSGDVQKQYYLRLPNNEGYARLKMTVIPDYNETGAMDLDYAINPTLSRILESDEKSWYDAVSKGQGAIELVLRHKPATEDTP